MKKANVLTLIDAASASLGQYLTMEVATSRSTAPLAVAAAAIFGGLSKDLVARRAQDVLATADLITTPAVKKMIEKIDEQKFIDDFTYCVGMIIRQRVAEKRVILRSAYKGYIMNRSAAHYPLERLFRTIDELTVKDVSVLRKIITAQNILKKYPVPWVQIEIMNNHKIPKSVQSNLMILHSPNADAMRSIRMLESLGLVVEWQAGVGMFGSGEGYTQYRVTDFGLYLKDYLLESKTIE